MTDNAVVNTVTLADVATVLDPDTPTTDELAATRLPFTRRAVEAAAGWIARRAVARPTDHAGQLRTLARVRGTLSLWGDRALAALSYLALIAAMGPIVWLVIVGATNYTRSALLLAALAAAVAAGWGLCALRNRALLVDHRLQCVAADAFLAADQWSRPAVPGMAAGLVPDLEPVG